MAAFRKSLRVKTKAFFYPRTFNGSLSGYFGFIKVAVAILSNKWEILLNFYADLFYGRTQQSGEIFFCVWEVILWLMTTVSHISRMTYEVCEKCKRLFCWLAYFFFVHYLFTWLFGFPNSQRRFLNYRTLYSLQKERDKNNVFGCNWREGKRKAPLSSVRCCGMCFILP